MVIRDQERKTYLDEPVAAVLDGLTLLRWRWKIVLAALVLDELEDLLDAEALHMRELLVVDFAAGDHLLLALPDLSEPLAGAVGLLRDEVGHLVDKKVVAFSEAVENSYNLTLGDRLNHLDDQDRVRTEISIST